MIAHTHIVAHTYACTHEDTCVIEALADRSSCGWLDVSTSRITGTCVNTVISVGFQRRRTHIYTYSFIHLYVCPFEFAFPFPLGFCCWLPLCCPLALLSLAIALGITIFHFYCHILLKILFCILQFRIGVVVVTLCQVIAYHIPWPYILLLASNKFLTVVIQIFVIYHFGKICHVIEKVL